MIFYSKMYILHCLVPLNSVRLKHCLFQCIFKNFIITFITINCGKGLECVVVCLCVCLCKNMCVRAHVDVCVCVCGQMCVYVCV